VTLQKMVDMPLHQGEKIDSCTWVTRIPGGWLYETYVEGESRTAVFVPLPPNVNPVAGVDGFESPLLPR